MEKALEKQKKQEKSRKRENLRKASEHRITSSTACTLIGYVQWKSIEPALSNKGNRVIGEEVVLHDKTCTKLTNCASARPLCCLAAAATAAYCHWSYNCLNWQNATRSCVIWLFARTQHNTWLLPTIDSIIWWPINFVNWILINSTTKLQTQQIVKRATGSFFLFFTGCSAFAPVQFGGRLKWIMAWEHAMSLCPSVSVCMLFASDTCAQFTMNCDFCYCSETRFVLLFLIIVVLFFEVMNKW